MSIKNNPIWTQLAEREKHLVIGLVIFLGIMAVYFLIWSPIQTSVEQKNAALHKAESEWMWLVEQAPKVTRASKNSTLSVHSKTALMDSLQKSLRQKRLLQETEGLKLNNNGVTVKFDQVDAPQLFRWIAELEQKGLTATSMRLTPLAEGITQAEIIYEVVN